TVTAAVKAPTNVTRGLQTANRYASALSVAKQQGFKGDEAVKVAIKATADPDPTLAKRADALWEQSSNINESKIANKVANLFDAKGEKPHIRGLIGIAQNSIQPFTSFLV